MYRLCADKVVVSIELIYVIFPPAYFGLIPMTPGGVYQPWAKVGFGRSKLAGRRSSVPPDYLQHNKPVKIRFVRKIPVFLFAVRFQRVNIFLTVRDMTHDLTIANRSLFATV